MTPSPLDPSRAPSLAQEARPAATRNLAGRAIADTGTFYWRGADLYLHFAVIPPAGAA